MNTIEIRDNVFLLSTRNTSYFFYVNQHRHLEHLHYGCRVRIEDGEELALNEPTTSATTVTKDLPVKNLPAVKNVDGVTTVLGADAKPLLIADPFAGTEKPAPVTKTVAPPPIVLQPPEIPKPQESIVLTGTAISGENKTAMFLRGKETIFLTVGDEIDGRTISDITSDFVRFTDGSIITIGW